MSDVKETEDGIQYYQLSYSPCKGWWTAWTHDHHTFQQYPPRRTLAETKEQAIQQVRNYLKEKGICICRLQEKSNENLLSG